MAVSGLSNAELRATLEQLQRLYQGARREYSDKRIQHETLGRELEALEESMKSLRGSMAVIQRSLGGSDQIALPEIPKVDVKPKDASDAAMRLVAAKNESGGITFDDVLSGIHRQGFGVSREYMHTILNRKKNYQKKLRKEGDKFFLTDKGKEELGIESGATE